MIVTERATARRGAPVFASKDTRATTAPVKAARWEGHWPISPALRIQHMHLYSVAIKGLAIIRQGIANVTVDTQAKVVRPPSATTIVTTEGSA